MSLICLFSNLFTCVTKSHFGPCIVLLRHMCLSQASNPMCPCECVIMPVLGLRGQVFDQLRNEKSHQPLPGQIMRRQQQSRAA